MATYKTTNPLKLNKGYEYLFYIHINNGTKKHYIQEIARNIEATYSYASHLTKYLLKYGFITSKESGRKNFIECTEKGKKLAELAYEIYQMLPEEVDL